MRLSPGTHLGHFEIVEAVGSGGMGEVYRARDARLGRDVAVKVLPDSFSRDETRLRRFEREARSASALNHPNILTVFDVGSADGCSYLVTEFVEGRTLRDLIGSEGMRPSDVVQIGAQIADGLAAAEGAGLVHRDLKPENVMVTQDGRVKILDFGLASVAADDAHVTETLSALTGAGIVVGTVGYGSPEQVRGERLDARSDLFSLGIILHEMLAGTPPFRRPNVVETLNAILKDDPPSLPDSVPASLRSIVSHCLEKDARRRFQAPQDLAFALRSLSSSSTSSSSSSSRVSLDAAGRPPRRAWAFGAMALAAGALVGVGAWLATAMRTSDPDLSRIQFEPFAIDVAFEDDAAWSPDGKTLAYLRHTNDGGSEIVFRAADSSSTSVLMRDADRLNHLVWAPDGSRLFFIRRDGNGGNLHSIGALGGATRLEIPGAIAADVAADGRTVAAWKVTTVGDTEEAALWIGTLGGELTRYDPAPFVIKGSFAPNVLKFSPDGARVLLWVLGGPAEPRIVTVPADGARGREAIPVFPGRISGLPLGADWFPDSQKIVLTSGGSLWLGDFVRDRLTPLTLGSTNLRKPAVAPDGNSLVYTDWHDEYDVVTLPLEDGVVQTVINTSRYDGAPAWAPGARGLAYVTTGADGEEIWVRTKDDETGRRVLSARDMPDTSYRSFKSLTYSPDGQWLAFMSSAVQPVVRARIWIVPAAGGTPRAVTDEGNLATRVSWAPDSRSLVVSLNRGGPANPWIVSLDGSHPPRELLASSGMLVRLAEWSPTGDWIAAVETTADGQAGPTLLIKPSTGEVRRLPPLGSSALMWSRDGRTLFGVDTREPTAKLVALDVPSGTVRVVKDYGQRLQFAENLNATLRFNLSPDGRSFATTLFNRRADLWKITNLPK